MLNPRDDLTPCERPDPLPFASVPPTPRAPGDRRPCAADPAADGMTGHVAATLPS